MCPHFHMSIQSANSEVLQGMKRNYHQRDVVESLHAIQARVPCAFVGMDVIAGFPNETEERFLDTVRTLEQVPWTRLHVFPYSERPGTFAARMKETVAASERALRARTLRDLSHLRYSESLRGQVGKIKKTLVLKKPSKGCHGLTRDYWPVQMDVKEDLLGQETRVRIKGVVPPGLKNPEGHLLGEIEEAHALA